MSRGWRTCRASSTWRNFAHRLSQQCTEGLSHISLKLIMIVESIIIIIAMSCSYYVGHTGKFGHEFLEFEFRPDGESGVCVPARVSTGNS